MAATVYRVLGWVMVCTASLGVVGVLDKPPRNPGGVAVILCLLAAGGVRLLWTNRRSVTEAPAMLPTEQAVLKTARKLNGRVTAAEVAAESSLPLHSVQEELDRLEKAGACTSLVGETGIMVFLFAEFEDPSAKQDVFAGDEERRLREHSAALAASIKNKT